MFRTVMFGEAGAGVDFMKNMFAAILLAAAVISVPAGFDVEAANCSISRAEARKLMSQQGLISAAAAARIAAQTTSGRVINARLCQSGGQYYYNVNVTQSSGGGNRLRSLRIDARNGAVY